MFLKKINSIQILRENSCFYYKIYKFYYVLVYAHQKSKKLIVLQNVYLYTSNVMKKFPSRSKIIQLIYLYEYIHVYI